MPRLESTARPWTPVHVAGVVLALAAAVTHAAWNTVGKRVSEEGLPAQWAFTLAAALLVLAACMVTLAACMVTLAAGGSFRLTTGLLVLAPVSTVLHTSYGLLLQRAYRSFDVSQIYPLSRGLAPVLVMLGTGSPARIASAQDSVLEANELGRSVDQVSPLAASACSPARCLGEGRSSA